MNKNKIQLGKFLKKENWEFHFAVGGIFEQSENFCFQKVCEEADRSNPVESKLDIWKLINHILRSLAFLILLRIKRANFWRKRFKKLTKSWAIQMLFGI